MENLLNIIYLIVKRKKMRIMIMILIIIIHHSILLLKLLMMEMSILNIRNGLLYLLNDILNILKIMVTHGIELQMLIIKKL